MRKRSGDGVDETIVVGFTLGRPHSTSQKERALTRFLGHESPITEHVHAVP